MSENETFEQFSERVKKEAEENLFVVVKPFDEMSKCACLLNKDTSKSFDAAREAYFSSLHHRKDTLLRAKAFRAFSKCYSDMGLDRQAVDMTRKWQELANRALRQ